MVLPVQLHHCLSESSSVLSFSVAAGLPDHWHMIRQKQLFQAGTANNAARMDGNYLIQSGLASVSNNIYGNSDTVTPESLKCKYFIRYA